MSVRLSLALLVGIPAALAYPWDSVADRWLLGIAVGIVVIVLAWWRGHFVTTLIARRVAMWRRRSGGADGTHHSSEHTTVTLEVSAREQQNLPIDLIAGYLDRYGLRFDKVRVTARDRDGVRTTWVGLTLGAVDNVAALSARSSRIPLQDTAEVAARRLADHLRESGFEVSTTDTVEPVTAAQAKETWRSIADERGHLAAYRITVDEALTDTLQAVWSLGAAETWTALELSGSRADPTLVAACVLRTADQPGAQAPMAGLTAENGLHGVVTAALSPTCDRRLPGRPVTVSTHRLSQLDWPAGAQLSRT